MDTTTVRPRARRTTFLPEASRLLAAAVLGAAAGALGTWLLTRGEVAAAESAREDTRVALLQSRAQAALLGAQLAVDEAGEHLEQRNFGLAASSLDRAGLALGAVALPAAPPDVARQVQDLRAELEGVRLNVADDVDERVSRLGELEMRIGEIAAR